jgi:hypothetical protein
MPRGRTPKAIPAPEVPGTSAPDQTPLDYMLSVIRDPKASTSRRDRMALAAAPYLHSKVEYGSLKAQRQKAAHKTAGGKFGAAAAPQLVVVNNGKR